MFSCWPSHKSIDPKAETEGKVDNVRHNHALITVNGLHFERNYLEQSKKTIISLVLKFHFLCRKAQLPRSKVLCLLPHAIII